MRTETVAWLDRMSDEKIVALRDGFRVAANLIAAGWTKGAYARGADGQPASSYSKDGTQFCSVGAMRRAVADLNLVACTPCAMENVFESEIGVPNVFDWNDAPQRTHADVSVAFDRLAIGLEDYARTARGMKA